MADNFDTQVKFGADTADLKAGMEQASGEVKRATGTMNDSFKNLGSSVKSSMGQMTNAIANETSQSKAKMDSFASSITSQVKGIAAAFIGLAAAVNIGRSIVNTAADFESLEIQLRAVMGSAEKGDEAFRWIKQFAVDTPFSVESTTKAFMQLKNFGLDPMDGTLQKLADASAKYGAGADSMQRVTLAMGQAWARGKLQGQDILQMIDAGIPVYDMLSKATGKSAAQLQDMSQKGTITRDVMRQLIDELGKESAGTSDARMNSLAGAISNLGDAYANAIDGIRQKGGFAFLTESVQNLSNVIPELVGLFAEMGATIGDVISELWGVVKEAFGAIGDAIVAVFGLDSQPLSAMQIFINMLKVVHVAIIGLRVGIETAFSLIKTVLAEGANYFITFASVAGRALHLDFAGAKAAFSKGMDDAKAIVKQGMADIVDIANKGKQDMDTVLLGPATAPKVSGGTAQKPASADGSSNTAVKDQVAIWKAALEQKKEDEGNFFKDSTQMEVAFWESKLNVVKKGSKEERAVRHELYTLHKQEAQQELAEKIATIQYQMTLAKGDTAQKVELAKQEAELIKATYGDKSRQYITELRKVEEAERAHKDTMAKLEQEKLDNSKALALSQVELQRETLRYQKEMGDIKAADELNGLRTLKEQEYQIELKAAQDKLQFIKDDVVARQKAMDAIEQMAQKHALDMRKIDHDTTLAVRNDYQNMLQPISSAFDSSIKGMIQGTLTFQKAMSGIARAILGEFINLGVKKVTNWVATEMAMTSATGAAAATRTGIDTAAAATSGSVGVAAGIKNIMVSAWETMAAVYKAIAGIPYVGPFLAPAMAAGAFGVVAGYAGNLASAEGGYDIPDGVNPLAQLHKKEMVLPAKQADVIRQMADNGGTGGGQINLHFNGPTDRRGIERWYKENAVAMAPALRTLARNFVPVKT